MDHTQFSFKTQCYAILFNLIILSAQPLIILSLIWLLERYYNGRDLNVFFIFLFFLPLVWFTASTIFSAIALIISTHRHALIEKLSKESLSFLLSIALLLLVIDIATVALIYFFGYIDAPESNGTVYAIGVFSNLIVLLFTFCSIVYASIQISRRRIYNYPRLVRIFS
jgi:uncharacterized Tic20 family protein